MTTGFDQLSVPVDGEVVAYDEGFRSPEAPILPVAHGVDDGTIGAARRALEATAEMMGRDVHWFRVYVGPEARDRYGDPLPSDTVRALRQFRVGLVGQLDSDPRAAMELERELQSRIGLTASLERRTRLQWTPSPLRNVRNVDVTVVRDVTEDAQAGLEYPPETAVTGTLRECLLETAPDPDSVPAEPAGYSVRPVSEETTASLVETAVEYALDRDRNSLTIVHQGDILPGTEGSFLEWARDLIAEEYGDATIDEETFDTQYEGRYPDDELVVRERRTDIVCRELLSRPDEYDVVVAPSLGGHYVSTVAAESVGGPGMAPQVAVDDGRAVGVAPTTHDGQNEGPARNPTGAILSGCLLFEYLGWDDAAAALRAAISRTLADGLFPPDLAQRSARGTLVGPAAFVDAVVERLDVAGTDRSSGAGGVRTTGEERHEIKRLVAGVYNVVFEDHLSPADIELNQLLGDDEEAEIYLPEVGINFGYWRRWHAERRLEVLLHELAHVEEDPDEPDHGDEFYDRLVELTELAADWESELEALFGEPLDVDRVARLIVESVHEETIEPDDDVEDRRRLLREQFELGATGHY